MAKKGDSSILDQYIGHIIKNIKAGKNCILIEKEIRELGYNDSYRNVSLYVSEWKKNNIAELLNEGNSSSKGIKVNRTSLISLLYKPIDKLKDITNSILKKVCKKYPALKKIYGMVCSFKEILFGSEPNLLGLAEKS